MPAATNEVTKDKALGPYIVVDGCLRVINNPRPWLPRRKPDRELGLFAVAQLAARSADGRKEAARADRRRSLEAHVGANRIPHRSSGQGKALITTTNYPEELLGQPPRAGRQPARMNAACGRDHVTVGIGRYK